MTYRRQFACVLAIAALASCARADSTDSWRQAASDALTAKLHERHPEVTDWDIEPLIGKRLLQRLQDQPSAHATVTRLGRRSAVRLSWKQGRESLTVWFAVAGHRNLLTAKTAVAAGGAVSPELAVADSVNVMALTCDPIETAESLTDGRTRRALRAGDVLCQQSLEPRPPVARGQAVLVQAIAGAVTIVTRGIAEQDGGVGDVLRIRNPSTGDTYLAAVTGRDEVVVHE